MKEGSIMLWLLCLALSSKHNQVMETEIAVAAVHRSSYFICFHSHWRSAKKLWFPFYLHCTGYLLRGGGMMNTAHKSLCMMLWIEMKCIWEIKFLETAVPTNELVVHIYLRFYNCKNWIPTHPLIYNFPLNFCFYKRTQYHGLNTISQPTNWQHTQLIILQGCCLAQAS